MIYRNDYEDVEVRIQRAKYQNNDNLYLGLVDDNGLPFSNVTVNLGIKLPYDMAFVDVNMGAEIIDFIRENELGEFMGCTQRSGFVDYPLFRFNVEAISEKEMGV